jgi:hypothetical protein
MAMSQVTVHEFSSELRNHQYSQKYEQWVSGGYGREVNRDDVPEEICIAVKQQKCFQLNDNLGIKEADKVGVKDLEIALVARDLEKHSVLAVARWLLDEKGRPLIAYRYFWLRKLQSHSFDGVGTLLCWWYGVNQPRFRFPEEDNLLQSNDHTADIKQKDFFNHYSEVRHSEINSIPYAFGLQQDGNKCYDTLSLHAWTLKINSSSSPPADIAWAWNIQKLDYPERFTLIQCTDQKAYQNIKNDIHRLKLSRPVQDSSQAGQVDHIEETPRHRKIPAVQSSSLKQALSNAINSPPPSNKRRDAIANIVRNLEKLSNEQNLRWSKNDIFDSIIYENDVPKTAVNYRALLAILLPEQYLQEWLTYLCREQGNSGRFFDRQSDLSYEKYGKEAVDLQGQVLNFAENNEEFRNVYLRLVQNITTSIPLLLLKLCDPSTSNEESRTINWLFIEPQTFWNNWLVKYARQITTGLDRRSTPDSFPHDNFYRSSFELLKTVERHETSSNYKPLGDLLGHKQIGRYSLAAFFWVASGTPIPANCRKPIEVFIVRLHNEDFESSANVPNPTESPRKTTLLFPLIGLAIALLAASAITSLIINRFKPVSTTPTNQQDLIQVNLNYLLTNYAEVGDTQTKNRLRKHLQALQRYQTREGSKPKAYDEDREYIVEKFLPQPIVIDTLTKQERPKQEGIAIEILKYLHPDWDPQDPTAPAPVPVEQIKRFQTTKNQETQATEDGDKLPEDGTLSPETWLALRGSLESRRVQDVVTFLLARLDDFDSPQNFAQTIKMLNDCKQLANGSEIVNYKSCLKLQSPSTP